MKKVLVAIAVILISMESIAQKRIDTLNIDQLNKYKHNAVKLRNAGRAATLFGIGALAIGGTYALAVTLGTRDRQTYGMQVVPAIVGAGILAPCAAVGVPLWITGANRKKRADIQIQKLSYTPANSKSFGLRLTVRF